MHDSPNMSDPRYARRHYAGRVVEDDAGNEYPVAMRFDVCPVCHGNGKHVNPALDDNGLSEESASDADFMEDYMAGVYDVTCRRCGGLRVVEEPDPTRNPQRVLDLWFERDADLEQDDAIQRAEIAAGC